MFSSKNTLFASFVIALQFYRAGAFQISCLSQRYGNEATQTSKIKLYSESSTSKEKWVMNEEVCSAFTIQTCSSTACTKKKRQMGIEDEYAIFGGLYARKEDAGAYGVSVEEVSCLGSCKHAPCVGIQHEDFYGTVSLEGMSETEFQDQV